jgi:hypothetical protein
MSAAPPFRVPRSPLPFGKGARCSPRADARFWARSLWSRRTQAEVGERRTRWVGPAAVDAGVKGWVGWVGPPTGRLPPRPAPRCCSGPGLALRRPGGPRVALAHGPGRPYCALARTRAPGSGKTPNHPDGQGHAGPEGAHEPPRTRRLSPRDGACEPAATNTASTKAGFRRPRPPLMESGTRGPPAMRDAAPRYDASRARPGVDGMPRQ